MGESVRATIQNSAIFALAATVVFIGNIRTKDIKKASFQIVDMHRDRFTDDFETNKQVLKELNLIDKKLMRNKIAGYITRVMRRKKSI